MCQQERSHKNSTFKHNSSLNTKIQLNTRSMFKVGIFVFDFAKHRRKTFVWHAKHFLGMQMLFRCAKISTPIFTKNKKINQIPTINVSNAFQVFVTKKTDLQRHTRTFYTSIEQQCAKMSFENN
jgi:hypothetical protein